MDSTEKLRAGLLALGLSPERVEEFLGIVAGVKDRVRSEGLVYRGQKAARPKRRVRLTYKPPRTQRPEPGSYDQVAEATLGRMGRAPLPSGIPEKTARLIETMRGLVSGPARTSTPPATGQVIIEPAPDAPVWQREQWEAARRIQAAGASADATLQSLAQQQKPDPAAWENR